MTARFAEQELIITLSENQNVDSIITDFLANYFAELGSITEFHIDKERFTTELSPEKYLSLSTKIKSASPDWHHLRIQTSNDFHITIGAWRLSEKTWLPSIEIDSRRDDQTLDSITWHQRFQVLYQVASQYSDHENVIAIIIRNRRGGDWTPRVPGADTTEYVRLMFHPERVPNFYRDPSVFWNSWDKRESKGDRLLVSRTIHSGTVREYQESVYPRIWELARNAYPGHCKYYTPDFAPKFKDEELELFNHGERCLSWIGYDPENHIIEASCYTEEGVHIPSFEILELFTIINKKQMPDGRPVNTLRVVFPSKEMALREGVPLIDIGAKVIYLNPQMNDEELTAADYGIPSLIQ